MNQGTTAADLARLDGAPPEQWLTAAQQRVVRADFAAAIRILETAIRIYPAHVDLLFALGGSVLQAGDQVRAEHVLHQVLQQAPGHVAAALLMARTLGVQGRMRAAGNHLRTAFDAAKQDVETRIQAVELLDDFGRQSDALALCEQEIANGSTDARLYAYAGMLALQVGEFELARERYDAALSATHDALEWHAPDGLASTKTYRSHDDPDFARFRSWLETPGLSDSARSSLLFALGKAHDDIGDHAAAATAWRQANDLAHALTSWSRKPWRRSVQARLAATPLRQRLPPPADWTPIFIVGVPRSGTTLLAELLARHQQVCHRGELDWLPRLARQAALQPTLNHEILRRMADTYAAQARQDDQPPARWIIDKQPLNFRHVDLILALWPNARIMHCQRNTRDTALSLWSQSFHSDVHGYARSFADIATVTRDASRLMDQARRRYPDSIRTVRYEQLVTAPDAQVSNLSGWIGLPRNPDAASAPSSNSPPSALSTASLWQARQPVHTRSVGRWQAYAEHIPELLQLPDD